MSTKRGRKALAPAEQIGPQFIDYIPADEARDINALAERQQQIVEQFGDGLPWHPDHYEAAIRSELTRGCESFIRAGRYLIVARECALHGEWYSMLGRLGIEPEYARRMMIAAQRITSLPNPSRARDLIEATGTQSKLIELLSLPEDQFAELAEAGETGDLELDKIEHMTRDELRAAVREARADMAAKDERINKLSDDLNKECDKRAKATRTWKHLPPDEKLKTLRAELEVEVLQISIAIADQNKNASSLHTRIALLVEHGESIGIDQSVYLAGQIAQLERYLHQVRDDFGIPHQAVGDPAIEARLTLGDEE